MKRIVAHPVRMVLQICALLILLSMVLLYLAIGNYIAAIVFGVLLSANIYLNIDAFRIVQLDDTGISMKLFGLYGTCIPWDEIQEAGVICTNYVRRLAKDKHPGQFSLYVSKQKMTSEERLKACIHWPPDSVVEMAYTPQRMRELSFHWDKRWTLFNVSSAELFRDQPIAISIEADEIRY